MCEDITDDAQHCITFGAGEEAWVIHSEEFRRHDRSYIGEQLGELYRESFRQWHKIDIGFVRFLFDKTREIARRVIAEEEPSRVSVQRPLLDDVTGGANRRELLLRTADILSAILGVTLVMVGSRVR